MMGKEKTSKMFVFIAVGLMGFIIAQLFVSAQAQAPQTLIKTDGGVIVFIVDGQEQARIDAKGLHMNGDVNYSGMMTDTVTYQVPADQQKAGAE